MAGGTFDKQVGKDRPGTYINFQSGKHDTVGGSDRGIVIIPLKNHNYGPKGEFITLTAAAPDAAYAKLGIALTTATTIARCCLFVKRSRKLQRSLFTV